jgi:hypothetical protein
VGKYEELEKVLINNGFENEEDALNFAISRISSESEMVDSEDEQDIKFELIDDEETQVNVGDKT